MERNFSQSSFSRSEIGVAGMRRGFRWRLPSLLLALCLASGCGEDAGRVETPDGRPDGSTEEEPQPSPTYDTFPLQHSRSFDTISAELNYFVDFGGSITLGVVSTEQSSDRLRVFADTAVNGGVFGIDEEGAEFRFSRDEATVQPSPVFREFGFQRKSRTTAGQFYRLDYLNNSLAGLRTSDRNFQMEHVSYAIWSRAESNSRPRRSSVSIWGYPTIPSDMMARGVRTYTAPVEGRMVSTSARGIDVHQRNDDPQKVTGTATTTVNFATGLMDVAIDLAGGASDGRETTLGRYVGVASYAAGQNQFTGSVGDDNAVRGTIAGGFFGAAGQEFGMTFALSGRRTGVDYRIVGASLARDARQNIRRGTGH